jgi:hypothetical protein
MNNYTIKPLTWIEDKKYPNHMEAYVMQGEFWIRPEGVSGSKTIALVYSPENENDDTLKSIHKSVNDAKKEAQKIWETKLLHYLDPVKP